MDKFQQITGMTMKEAIADTKVEITTQSKSVASMLQYESLSEEKIAWWCSERIKGKLRKKSLLQRIKQFFKRKRVYKKGISIKNKSKKQFKV